jgi:hypothetical protein
LGPLGGQPPKVVDGSTRLRVQLTSRTISLYLCLFSLRPEPRPHSCAIHQRPTVTQDLGQQMWIAQRSL